MSGLSNADFRAMASQPRRSDASKSHHPPTESKSISFAMKRDKTASRRKKSSSSSQNKPKRPPNNASDNSHETMKRSGYRDRAAERRRHDGNTDDGNDKDGDVEDERMHVDVNNMPEHLTKYMGGDEKRSHMVKGLDYLLLQRSKDEMQHDIESKLEEEFERTTAIQIHGRIPSLQPKEPLEPQAKPKCHGFLAKALFERIRKERHTPVAQQSAPAAPISTFLPGRTVYEFNVDTFMSQELPVVLQRSKEDCPVPPDVMPSTIPSSLRSKLENIMEFVRSGSRPRKQAAPPVASSQRRDIVVPVVAQEEEDEDSDEDIFADVGDDYQCIVEPKNAELDHASDSTKHAYFGSRETVEEQIEEIIATPQPSAADLETQRKTPSEATPDTRGLRGFQPLEMDEYADMGADMSFGVYRSDNEEDEDTPSTQKAEPTSGKKKVAKEKGRINKQWQKISTIIDKRKKEKSGTSSKDDQGPPSKRSKVGSR